MARKPTMAELQKTSLVKYFASLSLKLGVSFVGGCSAYRWNCWWSWQASPGVPSLDTAGVRERARGRNLLWKMSAPFLSEGPRLFRHVGQAISQRLFKKYAGLEKTAAP